MRLRWTRNEIRSTTVGMSFLLPNILGFLIFTAVPLVISLFMAFTDWNLEMHNMFRTGSVKLVGFGNFTKLFTDPDFSFFLGNTLFLMLGIPFGIAGSLGAALLLNHNFKTGSRRLYWIIILTVIMTASCLMLLCVGMAASALTVIVCGVAGAAIIGGAFGGQSVYRTLFYLPSFTSGVATFILWKKLYSPENGPINNVLQPLLDCITPIASKLSPGAAAFLAGALLILMGSSALLTIRRRIRLWSLGECGSLGLVIGMTLLVTPLLCCRFRSALSWGGWFGAGIATLGILLAAVQLRRGRSFGCVYDYGLTDAVIIDGMFMLGLFCLLGLTNVVMAMPVDANAPGGYLRPEMACGLLLGETGADADGLLGRNRLEQHAALPCRAFRHLTGPLRSRRHRRRHPVPAVLARDLAAAFQRDFLHSGHVDHGRSAGRLRNRARDDQWRPRRIDHHAGLLYLQRRVRHRTPRLRLRRLLDAVRDGVRRDDLQLEIRQQIYQRLRI